MTKAGFITRFVAVFIDGLLFCGIGFAIHFPLFGLLGIVYETILISQSRDHFGRIFGWPESLHSVHQQAPVFPAAGPGFFMGPLG
jgi:hypothetical protein